MKCIILLTIVALCHSYPYGTGSGSGYGYGSWLGSGKNFNVNPDGSITITTANGKMVTISKGFGQNVVVDVTNPSGKYFWGYQKYQPTQVDTLAKILSQYQGDINQNVYQQLLGDVNYAVQEGQLGNGIYEALHKWNQIQGGFGGQLGQQWQQEQIQQLFQQAGLKQGFPYKQTTGQVIVPVGYNQQGQLVEKLMLQNPQMGYPYTAGLTFGNQGIFGQQGYGKQWAWNTLMNKGLYGNKQQTPLLYNQYGQYQVEPTTGQLLQVEGKILNQQNQIHQEQMQQHQQQQQMLNQQFQQQLQQQQLQGQQEYVQEIQEEMQKEQQHVLGQQQQVQEQQKYNTLMGLMRGTKSFKQTGDFQTGYWQQPSVFSQRGVYGGYGQGYQHNMPLVF